MSAIRKVITDESHNFRNDRKSGDVLLKDTNFYKDYYLLRQICSCIFFLLQILAELLLLLSFYIKTERCSIAMEVN